MEFNLVLLELVAEIFGFSFETHNIIILHVYMNLKGLWIRNDWIPFYTVAAIFQPCNGGDYQLNVIS